jgi:hypothetical protein
MSLTARYLLPLLIFAGAAALVAAPIAAADPALPQPGSENAADTISDLQRRGYEVQINWDNGLPNTDLSQCWVNSIDAVDATPQKSSGPTYVDVECPK